MPHALRLRPPAAAPRGLVAPHALDRGLRAWWNRNVVAMDPHPEAGRLDELDRTPVTALRRPVPVAAPVPAVQRVA